MIYEVRQLANMPQSDQRGYEQYFDIYASDGKWAGFASHSNIDCPPQMSKPQYLIQIRLVKADSAIGAYFKFDEWLKEGNDKSFLLS